MTIRIYLAVGLIALRLRRRAYLERRAYCGHGRHFAANIAAAALAVA